MTRPLLLLFVVALLLGIAAAPAQATLLVRADGTGLLIQDKNGIIDDVRVSSFNDEGRVAYLIINQNNDDFFKFDIQTGCRFSFPDRAICDRNGAEMNVQLARGDDKLDLSNAPSGNAHVAGGSGRDRVTGHVGRDSISGQSGDDRLKGGDGNDGLNGGDGADRLEGGNGNDTLSGKDGNDSLFGDPGGDVLNGGDQDDFIESREPDGVTAVKDEVDCGTGIHNHVDADLRDVDVGIFPCPAMEIGAVGETPNVKILGKTLRVSRTGRVRVRLRCPRGVKSLGCKGRLQLRLLGRRSIASRTRKVRYRIRAGRRKTVRLRLSAKDVRKLRVRPRRGRITSVEKGRKGPKTTVRSPLLKLRR